MVSEPRILKFFLGTNSPIGFVSRFDQITNARTLDKVYVLKGGPGSGKSTLMKKVAEAAMPYTEELEYIHCASDVDSLDAVIVPGLGSAIADGTPPHPIEPKYPGVFEQIIASGDCWDVKKLSTERDRVIELSDNISGLHKQAGRYLAAASALVGDNARTAAQCTDMEKVRMTAERIASRTFKNQHRKGTERVRFLSTVTNKGYRRAAAQMMDHAADAVAEAKALHDILETYYVAATDYKKLDTMTKRVISSFIK